MPASLMELNSSSNYAGRLRSNGKKVKDENYTLV
jgi:hypothetical protein